MNRNNFYQRLIQTEKIISPTIRTPIPIKDQKKVIDQQPDPSPSVMKASWIFPMPGESGMSQYIIPIPKQVPQDILIL